MADNKPGAVPRVYKRNWIVSDGDKPDFTVMTYNVLADKHMPDDKYLYCPADVRAMSWRHKHILAEIEEYGGDIVCLQEVEDDNFTQNLEPWFTKRGFSGVHMNRWFGSGQATFYDQSKFELIHTKKCHLPTAGNKYIQDLNLPTEEESKLKRFIDIGDCVILSSLKHKATGKMLYIGNIHVLWGELKYPGIQLMEIMTALRELCELAESKEAAVIFCGDFNSPPYWPGYLAMRDGKLNEEAMKIMREEPKDIAIPTKEPVKIDKNLIDYIAKIVDVPHEMKSSYLTVQGREPQITNSDDGAQDYISELCLDYMWYNPVSLQVKKVLETPPAEDIKKHTALPSVLFPSDHIALCASYIFK